MRMYLRSPIKNGVFVPTVMLLFGGMFSQKTITPWVRYLSQMMSSIHPNTLVLSSLRRTGRPWGDKPFPFGKGYFQRVEFALSFREGSFVFQSFIVVLHQCFPPIFAARTMKTGRQNTSHNGRRTNFCRVERWKEVALFCWWSPPTQVIYIGNCVIRLWNQNPYQP